MAAPSMTFQVPTLAGSGGGLRAGLAVQACPGRELEAGAKVSIPQTQRCQMSFQPPHPDFCF